MQARRAAAVWACLLTAACSEQTLMTRAMPVSGSTVAGVPYFLPRAVVPLTFKGGPPSKADKDAGQTATYLVQMTPGATTFIADTATPLFLAYEHSRLAEDHFNLSVDQNGLLQSSTSLANDRGGAVALRVVDLLGEIAKAPLVNGYNLYKGNYILN